jgi:hypothetical protein
MYIHSAVMISFQECRKEIVRLGLLSTTTSECRLNSRQKVLSRVELVV